MFYIFFCLTLAASTKAYYLTHRYDKYSSSIAEPRLGYATSIVHDTPDGRDLKAESSVNVEFSTFEPQKTNVQKYKGKVNFKPNGRQTEFYNVGYSVSFNGNSQNANSHVSQPQRNFIPRREANLENAEIITGRAKKNEQVYAPQMDDVSPKDYVSQALVTQKHLISGIKPKVFPNRHFEKPSKILLEQMDTFSPKTQHHIKGLEKTKALQQANQKYKNVQGPDFRTWKNLSPGVEIVKSAEIPVSQKAEKTVSEKYITNPHLVTKFNHASALESSQPFDISNGLSNPGQDVLTNSQQRSSYATAPTGNRYSASVQQNQFARKLPLDTSLLRDPVIITSSNNIPNDPRVIPIHFDLRQLQVAVPDALNYNPVEFNPKYNNNEVNQQSLQSEEIQNLHDDNGYDDHDTSESQAQYRVYGKPQSQTLDSFRYTNTPTNVNKVTKPREPRYGNNFNKYGTIRLPPLGQTFF